MKEEDLLIVIGFIGLPNRFVSKDYIKNPYYKENTPFKLQMVKKLKKLKSDSRFKKKWDTVLAVSFGLVEKTQNIIIVINN